MPHQPLPLNRVYLSHAFSEPAFGKTADTLFYVRSADGKRAIVRHTLSTGLAQVLTTDPAPAGGIGYGGGVFAVHEDRLVFAAKDGRLHGLNLVTGEQWPISPTYEGVAAPVISPDGQWVAFLTEGDRCCNVLLCDVRGKTLPVKLSADPWYAFNPTFSADGRRLAWMEWDEFDMPWDESRLRVATFAKPTGRVSESYQLLPFTLNEIGQPRVSYGSPQFSPGGRLLAFISDASGWRSVWVSEADGQNPQRVDTGPGEIGGPDWLPGRCALRWSTDGKSLFAVRRHKSRDTLLRISAPGSATERSVSEIATEWTHLEGLAARGEQLAFIGGNPAAPYQLVTLDARTGTGIARATTGIGLVDAASLSRPEVIHWPTTDEVTCWGVFYPATGDKAEGARPLIVHIHGGPTSEVPFGWHAQAQYFATRGWHYLLVNHRGGTGFGRAYQDLLNGQWGVVDVQDARSGAEHLIAQGRVNAQQVVITGGSAGGYTTLMALTQDPGFWAAGVSLYGIGNMYELRLGSHRFEVNYEFGLIGKLPETGLKWKERSPLTFVKAVRAPVLLFHGKEDRAVPYQQSVEFAEAVKRNNVAVELVLYDDEGHGFNKEANRRDCLERTEKFLEKYVINQQR
jgi:dipeptidyl aminopeptidase/acylaminoacyl peptidase